MPTTPTYALPYPASTNVPDVPTDMAALANQVALVLGGALAAVPPATPIEGQLWAMSPVAGTVWLFRYNAGSASTYKWEFVGGPPLSHEIITDEATGSTTYVDLATVGPQITLPRAGDYEAFFGCKMYNSSAGNNIFAALKRGAAATSDNDYISYTNPANFSESCPARSIRVTGMAASDILKMQYKTSAATASFSKRFLKVTPVRVS